MSTNPKYQETDKILAQVLLSTGTSLNVKLFVGDMQRVNDLLNDGRKFIPFEDVSGQLRLLNKAMIITVIPLDEEDANRRERGAAEETPPLSAPEDDQKETPQDGQRLT